LYVVLQHEHVFRRVPHQTHARGSIFMQIQKLWQVLRVFIARAQIFNGIFVPTVYTQKLDADIAQNISRYRKLHA
jgi:aminoglycoside/choline kinase family phosphotransferase